MKRVLRFLRRRTARVSPMPCGSGRDELQPEGQEHASSSQHKQRSCRARAVEPREQGKRAEVAPSWALCAAGAAGETKAAPAVSAAGSAVQPQGGRGDEAVRCPLEECTTELHPHHAQLWMSEQAAKLQRHVEQLSQIEEKLSESIVDRNAVSKGLLQLHGENVNINVSRLEGEVSQLHKALQEKTEALGKAKRALKRMAKELEAQQKKQEEEQADRMKKAAVLQHQVAQLKEENLSLRQQLSNLQQGGQEGQRRGGQLPGHPEPALSRLQLTETSSASACACSDLKEELKEDRDKIGKLTMELQLESQACQQLAARNQELQGLLVTLERKQCEQKAQARRREMKLLKKIEQLEASAGNALKLLEASSSLKIIKLEQKSQALEQELERARRRQKETERQLAFEKTAKESFMEFYQMSDKTIRSLQVDLELSHKRLAWHWQRRLEENPTLTPCLGLAGERGEIPWSIFQCDSSVFRRKAGSVCTLGVMYFLILPDSSIGLEREQRGELEASRPPPGPRSRPERASDGH
ncbi:centrosomal protein of 131 kDa-like [Melanerpes formicivorus]|uniref:centrosomal protein of 131 kDa-like n=1 Tax=Melanerpes formicivorus TaxID=211600 RepID=UPI00358FDB95